MKRITLFPSIGLVTAVLAAAACQQSGPTDLPLNVENGAATVTVDGVDLVVGPTDRGLVPAGRASSVIGPEGGEISVDGGTLTVPPAAMSKAIRITMSGRRGGLYRYRFGPSGLQFLVPATLTIEVDLRHLRRMGLDPERLGIAITSGNDGGGYDSDDASHDRGRHGSRYRGSGEHWEVVPAIYDPVTGTVSAQVEHFSQFALCLN
jgi:hypothetical protein